MSTPAAAVGQGFCFRPTPLLRGILPALCLFFLFARALPFSRQSFCINLPRGPLTRYLLLLFPAKRLFSMLFLFSFEKTPTLPRSFYSLSQHCHPTRNENPANQHLPQRGGGTSPARCRPHHRLMRNAHSIPLSRGYRGGQRPRRTLKGGQGGTIRRFPLLLSLPFQRERKK